MTQTTDEQSQPEASLQGHEAEKVAAPNDGTKIDRNPPQADPMPHQSNGDRRQRRGFCFPILAFFSAIGSMFAGMLSLTASAGQGMSKFYWHIPVLYGDKTTREWPEITGFKSGCAAGGKVSTTYLDCASRSSGLLTYFYSEPDIRLLRWDYRRRDAPI
jgi:hypothetical protein